MEPTQKLFDKYVAKMLEFRRLHCTELVSTSDLNGVTSLCELLDTLATPSNGVNPDDEETFERTLELWFIFSLSFGQLVPAWTMIVGRRWTTFFVSLRDSFLLRYATV